MTREAAPSYLPSLDGLRGIAVLMVMVCHFGPEPPVRTHAANLIARYSSAGWAGVDMFFVLSGFLITRILLASKADPRYFRNFYIRRILRIFPLYYLTLLSVFVLLPVFAHTAAPQPAGSHQVWLWTYTANLLVAERRTWLFLTPYADLNHFWSLAIEEQFYLVWPLVVAFLPKPRLLHLTALGLVASPLLRLVLQRNGAVPMTLYTLTPCRLDGLLAGAMIAAAISEPAQWSRLRSLATPALIASAIGLAFIVQGNGPSPISRAMAVPGYFFVTCFFAAVLVKVLAGPETWLARGLRSRVLVTVGKYSYGLYVLHRIGVVRWLVDTNPFTLGRLILGGAAARTDLTEPVGLVAYILICTLVSFPIAIASYWIVERPFLNLKSVFSYAPSSAPSSAPSTPHRTARRRRRVVK